MSTQSKRENLKAEDIDWAYCAIGVEVSKGERLRGLLEGGVGRGEGDREVEVSLEVMVAARDGGVEQGLTCGDGNGDIDINVPEKIKF